MRIPTSRATVCDILRYDRYVPTYAHDRIFHVGPLVAARSSANSAITANTDPKNGDLNANNANAAGEFSRISWPAIWMKAYALTAERFPRMNQTWMSWPTSHLYQHHETVGTLVVHRRFENDDWLFWGQITGLANRPLVEIQKEIDRFQNEPVEKVFRRQLWLARKPALFRRLCWWLTFQVSGKKKCKRLGTFFLSTISGKGAEIQDPPSMLTSGFTYGPLDENGNTRVTVTYDHRLMDGHHIADVLTELESTMNSHLLDELLTYSTRKKAA